MDENCEGQESLVICAWETTLQPTRFEKTFGSALSDIAMPHGLLPVIVLRDKLEIAPLRRSTPDSRAPVKVESLIWENTSTYVKGLFASSKISVLLAEDPIQK